MEKYLSEADLSKLESFQKDQIISKLETLLLQKDAAIIKHQQEQLKLKISLLDFENYKLQNKISNKNEQLQKLLKEAKEFHSELEEKHELNPGWGYDPDSLKLIQRED